MRCDECQWWVKNPRTVTVGECHRMPPFPADDIAAPRYWPTTKRDDFCGEFTLRLLAAPEGSE